MVQLSQNPERLIEIQAIPNSVKKANIFLRSKDPFLQRDAIKLLSQIFLFLQIDKNNSEEIRCLDLMLYAALDHQKI